MNNAIFTPTLSFVHSTVPFIVFLYYDQCRMGGAFDPPTQSLFMKFFTTTLAHGFSTPLHSLTILQWVLLLPFRFCFVPCNRRDYFVIEVHVKAGLPSEIYADGQNKVHIHVTFERIIRYTILKCGYACNILHRCG